MIKKRKEMKSKRINITIEELIIVIIILSQQTNMDCVNSC